MKIWLDAGHGGKDPGTSGFGVVEKDWTLDIDNRIANVLFHNNSQFERTRNLDSTVVPSIRASRVRNSKADYCISSHINAGGGKGAETIYSIYSKTGERLAQLILNELGEIGLDKRKAFSRKGSNGDYYYMHRNTGSVTTIIVEYGFIDNKSDNQFLSLPQNRQKCAEAVVKGIFKLEGIIYKSLENAEEDDYNNADKNDKSLLRKGDHGEKVKELQENLINLGYLLDEYGVDGIFGEETEKAVKQFQKQYHLLEDGIVGPQTQSKIQELLSVISKEDIYRVIVDGEQIGAFQLKENILLQVDRYLGKANNILLEKIKS